MRNFSGAWTRFESHRYKSQNLANVYLKLMHFIVCSIYHNKNMLKKFRILANDTYKEGNILLPVVYFGMYMHTNQLYGQMGVTKPA